jgi:alkylated DNA repair protein (DNA oxidative demethylase)
MASTFTDEKGDHMRVDEIEVAGLRYYPEAIDVEEETRLTELCEAFNFREITMRGMTARRTIVCFGYDYQYRSRSVVAVDPIPAELFAIKTRAATLASVSDSFDQVIVSRYPVGAGIGWHVDSPVFHDVILGLSLAAFARLHIKSARGSASAALPLARRSLYMLSGPARSEWQHRVSPISSGIRYSITFRTVRASVV